MTIQQYQQRIVVREARYAKRMSSRGCSYRASMEKCTRDRSQKFIGVRSSQRPGVRAICYVGITHVDRVKNIVVLLDNQSVAPVASLFLHNMCSERTCGRAIVRQSFSQYGDRSEE